MSRITDKTLFCKQLSALEKVYADCTGREMAPFYRPPEGRFLDRLLSRLHLGDIDSGDLLLLLILFFLFREEADEEVLIAIGLLLIL